MVSSRLGFWASPAARLVEFCSQTQRQRHPPPSQSRTGGHFPMSFFNPQLLFPKLLTQK